MSGDPADLDALVERAAAGDDDALSSLYRELSAPLVGFLIGLVGGEAEDLAAEAWIDAAHALSGFDGDGAGFRRLLFTIARRRAVDHLRARSRRRTTPVDVVPVLVPEPDVADVVTEADEARSAVERLFSLLPKAQAEVVVLRVVSGLPVSDVASIVGRTPAQVSVLQSRGLRRLATKLEHRTRWRGEFRASPQTLQDPAPFERRDG